VAPVRRRHAEFRRSPVRRRSSQSITQPIREAALPEEQQQLRIILDEETAQGSYVNFANIIHSPGEFVVDLGRVVPGRPDVKISTRLILSPLHAKQFLQALTHNVALYEQKFGEIRLDLSPAFPAASEEPSN
jgi:hypothetical protein